MGKDKGKVMGNDNDKVMGKDKDNVLGKDKDKVMGKDLYKVLSTLKIKDPEAARILILQIFCLFAVIVIACCIHVVELVLVVEFVLEPP